MPFLHRHLGNPVLSLLARVFFRAPVGDVYCGLRGLLEGGPRTAGPAERGHGVRPGDDREGDGNSACGCRRCPTPSRPGRGRPSHLHPWRDGRRSLLLYLASMPRGLFLYPGLLLVVGGLAGRRRPGPGPVDLGPGCTSTSTPCSTARPPCHRVSARDVLGVPALPLMVAERLLPADPDFMRRLSAIRLELRPPRARGAVRGRPRGTLPPHRGSGGSAPSATSIPSR